MKAATVTTSTAIARTGTIADYSCACCSTCFLGLALHPAFSNAFQRAQKETELAIKGNNRTEVEGLCSPIEKEIVACCRLHFCHSHWRI